MYLKDGLKKSCTGCMACMNVCPHGCITETADEDGYLYPQVDENQCTECGLCESVCPVVNQKTSSDHQQRRAFLMQHFNQSVSIQSSSSGAFSALSAAYCNNDYAIFGAAWDDHLSVKHRYITNLKDIRVFQKSKYVQSDIRFMYQKVKLLLDGGGKVLFSGTPCQVAGLSSYLKKDYGDKLLLIDIACRGVPSQHIFDSFIRELEMKKGERIESFTFRYKDIQNNRVKNIRAAKYQFSNGRTVLTSRQYCPYLEGYYSSLFYRPSCYCCPFRHEKGSIYSDITIADFWNVRTIFPEVDSRQGASLAVGNSPLGVETILSAKAYAEVREADYEKAVLGKRDLLFPTPMNPHRQQFLRLWKRKGFHHAVYRCNKTYRIKMILMQILGERGRSFLKRLIGKG